MFSKKSSVLSTDRRSFLKIIHIFTAFLLCILFVSTLLFSNLPCLVLAKPGTVYTAIGDSITEGSGMTCEEDIFVSRLSTLLSEKYPDLVTYNFGKNGDTIADLRKRLQDASIADKLRTSDFITLTIGGNDILAFAASAAEHLTSQNYSNAKKIPEILKRPALAKLLQKYLKTRRAQQAITTFLESFSKEFTGLLDEITALNPDAIIAVQTIYNPVKGSEYDTLAQCIDTVMIPANERIKKEIQSRNDSRIRLLDTYTLFDDNATTYVRITEDDIHPTREGHRLLARQLYPLLTTSPAAVSTAAEKTADSTEASQETLTRHNQATSKKPTAKQKFLKWTGGAFVVTILLYLLFKIRHNVV